MSTNPNTEPTFIEITEGIYRLAEAAKILKESDILKDEVIIKANELALMLLDKLEGCIDCLELNCCQEEEPCGCQGEGGEDIGDGDGDDIVEDPCSNFELGLHIYAFETFFSDYYNPILTINPNVDLSLIEVVTITAYDDNYSTEYSYVGIDAQNLFVPMTGNSQNFLGFDIFDTVIGGSMQLNTQFSDPTMTFHIFVRNVRVKIGTKCGSFCTEIELRNDDVNSPHLYMPAHSNFCK